MAFEMNTAWCIRRTPQCKVALDASEKVTVTDWHLKRCLLKPITKAILYSQKAEWDLVTMASIVANS